MSAARTIARPTAPVEAAEAKTESRRFPSAWLAGTLGLLAVLLLLSRIAGSAVMAPGGWLAVDDALFARANGLAQPLGPVTNVLFIALNSPGIDYLFLIALLFGYGAMRAKDRMGWIIAAAAIALTLNVAATWEVQRASAAVAGEAGADQARRARPFTRMESAVTPVQACGGLHVVAMRDATTQVLPCDGETTDDGRPTTAGAVRGQDWRAVWEHYPSFPSGHMREVAALGVLIAAFWRAAAPWMAAYGLVMAFSRVLLGAHYPTDVLGGTSIGVLSASTTLAGLHTARRGWEYAYARPRIRRASDWLCDRKAPAPRAFRSVLAMGGLHVILLAVCVAGASPGLKNVYEVAEEAGRWTGTHVVSVLDGGAQLDSEGAAGAAERSRAAAFHAFLAPSVVLYAVLGAAVLLLTFRRGRRDALFGGLTLLFAAVLAFELHLLGELFLDRPEAFSERTARAVPEGFRAAWGAVDGLPNLHALLVGAWAASIGAALKPLGIPAHLCAAAAALTAVNVGAAPFPDAIAGYVLGTAAHATARYVLTQLLPLTPVKLPASAEE